MLKDLIAQLDRAPLRTLLLINVAFAAFVGIAHGGALALTFHKATGHDDFIRTIATFSLPLVAIVLGSSAVALFKTRLRSATLAIHALIFVLVAVASVGWAASLVLQGIPFERFSWTPGLLSLQAAYSVYLIRRFWLTAFIERSKVVRYSHVFAFFGVLVVELGVIARLATTIGRRFHHF